MDYENVNRLKQELTRRKIVCELSETRTIAAASLYHTLSTMRVDKKLPQ
jgi:hypothetical protein